MTINIDNAEIEHFFVTELKSDVKKFSEFILLNLEKYKHQNEFNIKVLNPKDNSHILDFDMPNNVEIKNPFEHIEDVSEYSAKLRDNAWR